MFRIVSALADPFTGFGIIVTCEGIQSAFAGVSGTSLANPIFTDIWVIADRYNGKALGQAGPAVAKLKSGQITDVLPTSFLSVSDVSGTVYDSNGLTFYSRNGLFEGCFTMQANAVDFPFSTAAWICWSRITPLLRRVLVPHAIGRSFSSGLQRFNWSRKGKADKITNGHFVPNRCPTHVD